MFLLLVSVTVIVAEVFAATSHRPHVHHTHPTKEAVVQDTIMFKYDPKTHMMAAISHHNCYIYAMSATESTDVHTQHGLHMLEMKLISMVDDTTKTYTLMTHDEVKAVSTLLSHSCHRQNYKLN